MKGKFWTVSYIGSEKSGLHYPKTLFPILEPLSLEGIKDKAQKQAYFKCNQDYLGKRYCTSTGYYKNVPLYCGSSAAFSSVLDPLDTPEAVSCKPFSFAASSAPSAILLQYNEKSVE